MQWIYRYKPVLFSSIIYKLSWESMKTIFHLFRKYSNLRMKCIGTVTLLKLYRCGLPSNKHASLSDGSLCPDILRRCSLCEMSCRVFSVDPCSHLALYLLCVRRQFIRCVLLPCKGCVIGRYGVQI